MKGRRSANSFQQITKQNVGEGKSQHIPNFVTQINNMISSKHQVSPTELAYLNIKLQVKCFLNTTRYEYTTIARLQKGRETLPRSRGEP